MTAVRSRHTHAAIHDLLTSINAVEIALAVRRRELLVKQARTQLQQAVARIFQQQKRAFLKAFVPYYADASAIGEAGVWLAGILSMDPAPIREAAQPQWDDLWDEVAATTMPAFQTALQRAAAAALKAGGEYLSAQLRTDISFDLANPRAVAWIKQYGESFINDLNQTTRADIQRIIRDGVASGESAQTMANSIRAQFAHYSAPDPVNPTRTRAETIATHVAGTSYEAGNLEAAQQMADAGLTIEKRWVAFGPNPCPAICAPNADEGWLPVEQAFQSGHGAPMGHPGCLCYSEYRNGSNEGAADAEPSA